MRPALASGAGRLLVLTIVLACFGVATTGRPARGVAAVDGRPSWGSPIAVSPADGAVWVVNPDAASVSVVHEGDATRLREIPVGGEPWSVALAPDGTTAYVLDRSVGRLIAIDTATSRPRASIAVGPEPAQVALSPTGRRAFVTLTAAHEVAVIDTERFTLETRLPVAPLPQALAVSDDGDDDERDERVYVTHLQSRSRTGGREATDDGREGQVTVIDMGTLAALPSIPLPPDVHGFPALSGGISLRGDRAWIPHVRAAPDLPNTFETTVFAAVAVVDLARGLVAPSESVQLNDEDVFGSAVSNPVAAIPAPDRDRLYVVPAGSDVVEVVDLSDPGQPRLVKFLPAGRNPRGLALSADGRRGYVMSYLSRSVTVLDLEQLRWVAEIPVTAETLRPDVLRGKILFNNAVDPRLTRRGWMACASCHPDGGTDGVTWRFPDGPRQTPALWNAARTLPWHWSAALDEEQDVEDTVHSIQEGIGLAPGADPRLLGPPNAGRSADLDALAAYLQFGIRLPAVPEPTDPRLAEQGRDLFRKQGCPACHGGPEWTASALPGAPGSLDPDANGMIDSVLRDVGTLHRLDVRGQTGFDPPSLLGAGLTTPYFHDGSQATLEALLASGHPRPRPATPAVEPVSGGSPLVQLFLPFVSGGSALSQAEIAALAAFVRSIGPATPPENARGE